MPEKLKPAFTFKRNRLMAPLEKLSSTTNCVNSSSSAQLKGNSGFVVLFKLNSACFGFSTLGSPSIGMFGNTNERNDERKEIKKKQRAQREDTHVASD